MNEATSEVQETEPGDPRANYYTQLQVAAQDLLAELGIDEWCLKRMAKGYSPSYPGGPGYPSEKNHHCKVQLSTIVAQKLISAGVTMKSLD